MVSNNPVHAAQARWLLPVLLLCLGGCAAWQFHESRRPLGSYQSSAGIVQQAALYQSTGKNKLWHIRFFLIGQPEACWLDSNDPALPTTLQQAQAQQAVAIVYHDTNDERAYQVEAFGNVVCALDEGHRNAAGGVVSCLLMLAVAVPLAFNPILEKLAAPAETDA